MRVLNWRKRWMAGNLREAWDSAGLKISRGIQCSTLFFPQRNLPSIRHSELTKIQESICSWVWKTRPLLKITQWHNLLLCSARCFVSKRLYVCSCSTGSLEGKNNQNELVSHHFMSKVMLETGMLTYFQRALIGKTIRWMTVLNKPVGSERSGAKPLGPSC